MNGVKTKRLVWTVVFLGITLAAIVMEVVAGIFHPAGTMPWTEYLARYVPWPFQLIAYVALAVWLPFHFWRHDHLRKDAFEQGRAYQRAVHLRSVREMREALAPKCSHGYVFGSLPSDAKGCGERPSGAQG